MKRQLGDTPNYPGWRVEWYVGASIVQDPSRPAEFYERLSERLPTRAEAMPELARIRSARPGALLIRVETMPGGAVSFELPVPDGIVPTEVVRPPRTQ